MKITKSQVTKYCIQEKNIDAVNVTVEDFKVGQGRIGIECFGDAWSHYWSHMGEGNTLKKFFVSCDKYYIAKKLSRIPSSIIDETGFESHMKKEIIRNRRENEIDKSEARDLFNSASFVEYGSHEGLMSDVFGYEWYEHLPMRSNHEYERLCGIIKLVQKAFEEEMANDLMESGSSCGFSVDDRVRILRKDAGKNEEGQPLFRSIGRIKRIDGYYIYVRINGLEEIEMELYPSEIELVDDLL